MKKMALREAQGVYEIAIDDETLTHEKIVLERDGEPVAVVVPIGEYEELHVLQQDRERRHKADLEAFERERKAYDQLEPKLIPEYEGLYVAIRDGQVIDSDSDEMTLVMRVYEKFGYGPMYVRKVGAPLPVRRLPSPRIIRT
jgi:PHD/YefM family antitoxin component YafN of YafNO toxin-antitoxin module